jgi:peptide/nickel transport system ATP-binding protein
VIRQLGAGGSVDAGRIDLAGRDLLELADAEMREVWRRRIKLVPQDPVSSLNPRLTIGRQLAEGLDPAERGRRDTVLELLTSVGLMEPERVVRSYPHQLSGGMQQRVMIAMALAAEPELLILDEPTTNLDVTTEANILDLVRELIEARDTAVLYVSHSLGVVAQLCDRVAVLYAGELVEDAAVEELYRQPLHPYTQGLLDSLPRIGQDRWHQQLLPIGGSLPRPGQLPGGCVFAPRCPIATDFTREVRPQLEDAGDGRRMCCHRWHEIAAGEVSAKATPLESDAAAPDTAPYETVLATRYLSKTFAGRRSLLEVVARRPGTTKKALDGVDLAVSRQRTLGLVGESGSGK